MTGVYITLISGFIDLFGWDMLLLAAGVDSTRFGDLANRYASWMQQYYDALAEADVPCIMMHDDVWSSGPILPTVLVSRTRLPQLQEIPRAHYRERQEDLYTSDGNFDEFIDDIADAGVHGFVFEPLTSLETMVERYGQTHVIIGNADTRILLFGTKDDIRAEVERCMSVGRNCPGFFMAVGNHMPSNTPGGECDLLQ